MVATILGPKLGEDASSAVTVLVSSLEYFRNLESERWKLIADRLEGASELTMPKQFIATQNSPELEMINNSGVAEGVALKVVHVIGNGRVDLSGAEPSL